MKKGRDTFTSAEIAELERLITIRTNTPPERQKAVRDKMRKIGFFGSDFGITDMTISKFRALISSGRIKVSDKIIPPSSKVTINTPISKNISQQTTPKPNTSSLITQLEKARLKYKPEKVKYLLIAEAPPDSVERFFYYENVRQHDYLFLGVAQALYPELKTKFISSGRRSDIKETILNKMKADGFYLLDLSDLPLSLMSGDLSSQIPVLINKIKKVADEKTKIILIKATIFDIAYHPILSSGIGNVVNERIPFPGQGGQIKFQEHFAKALKVIGYKK